jgi:hypothetical protein
MEAMGLGRPIRRRVGRLEGADVSVISAFPRAFQLAGAAAVADDSADRFETWAVCTVRAA